jgi:hypothetical protein
MRIVSWYITKVTAIQTRIAIPRGIPIHKYADTKTYAEQLASVAADISNPSGAIVIVAAMPNTVLIDIALKIFIILLPDIKDLPLIAVNTRKHPMRNITAAQSTKNFTRFCVRFCVIISTKFLPLVLLSRRPLYLQQNSS